MSRRRLALAAGAALLVAALTGCGKVTVDTLVYDDASYDMTLYMLGEDAQVEATGTTTTAFSDLLVSTFEGTPGTEDWTFTPYSADGYSGVEAVGSSVAGDDVAMFGTGLFTADDETITFDFQYPMSLVVSGSGLTADQAAAVTLGMTVEFPGDVIDHNGTLVDDRTVEWTAVASDDPDFTATAATSTAAGDEPTEEATEEATEDAEAADDTASDADTQDADEDEGVNWLLWISVGVGVLALAGLVTWLVLRGRGPKSGGPGGPGAPQQWGQAPQGGQPQQWGQAPQGGQPQQWGQAPQGGQPQQWGQAPQGGQPQPGGQPQQWGQPQPGGQPQPPQQPGGQPQQPWGQQPPPA